MEELAKFKRQFHKIIDHRGLTGDAFYNVDETGLFYRMLPNKTLVSQEERVAPEYKKSKERVTVMACSNVTGTHKLKLALTGKSKHPRAFKKMDPYLCGTTTKKVRG